MSRAVRLKLRLPWYLRLWRLFVYVVFLLTTAVVVLAGTYYFIKLPRFKVSSVLMTGTTTVNRVALSNRIYAYLYAPRLSLLERDNVFTLNKGEMASVLLANFPLLKEVDTDWVDKTHLALSFTDRTSKYVWSTSSAQYLADETSYIFAPLSTTTKSELFHLKGRVESNPIGKEILSRDEITWISLLEGDLSPLNVELKGATLGENNDIDFETSEGWTLKTNTKLDGKALARSLSAVLRSVDGKGAKNLLSYVDLRFPKKAYFRLSDDILASTTKMQ